MKRYALFILLLFVTSVHATTIYGGTAATRNTTQLFIREHHLETTIYRIDLVNYKNKYYDGYAWYKERRITLYQQAWETQLLTVLRHETGHLLCEQQHLNIYNYQQNEACAEQQAEGLA